MSWNQPRLRRLLRGFRGKRILVVGDLGVDRYVFGAVERISPEAPVPLVRVERTQLKLGLAANVADNVRALGGRADLVGVVGRDASALDLRRLLRAIGVPPRGLVVAPGRPTCLKERVVSERQQLLRIDYEDATAVSPATRRLARRRIERLAADADAIVLQDYAKGFFDLELGQSLAALARRLGKPIVADPNARTPLAVYRGVTVLKPNAREAEALSGIAIRDRASLQAAGAKLLGESGAQFVLITRGREGIAIFEAGKRSVVEVPTTVREVYDVSGAGDTVTSVLALSLVSGATMNEAAILSNLAAGVEVGKSGTATVTVEEIIEAMGYFGK